MPALQPWKATVYEQEARNDAAGRLQHGSPSHCLDRFEARELPVRPFLDTPVRALEEESFDQPPAPSLRAPWCSGFARLATGTSSPSIEVLRLPVCRNRSYH
jgi:hypothetical protein